MSENNSITDHRKNKTKITDYKVNEAQNQQLLTQRLQSADSIHAINLLTSGLFTVNTMWTN